MKRITGLFLLTIMIVLMCSCAKTEVKGTTATLYYTCEGKNVRAVMTDDEADTVIKMFNGKSFFSDTPACSFGPECTILIGGKFYHIAKDGCPLIKDDENGKYFKISDKECTSLHNILEKYGATFPCY